MEVIYSSLRGVYVNFEPEGVVSDLRKFMHSDPAMAGPAFAAGHPFRSIQGLVGKTPQLLPYLTFFAPFFKPLSRSGHDDTNGGNPIGSITHNTDSSTKIQFSFVPTPQGAQKLIILPHSSKRIFENRSGLCYKVLTTGGTSIPHPVIKFFNERRWRYRPCEN